MANTTPAWTRQHEAAAANRISHHETTFANCLFRIAAKWSQEDTTVLMHRHDLQDGVIDREFVDFTGRQVSDFAGPEAAMRHFIALSYLAEGFEDSDWIDETEAAIDDMKRVGELF